MSTLATLNVVLNGDIGGFIKSMKDAEGQSSSSSNIIQRTLGGIGTAAKVAGGLALAGVGALAGGLVLAVKDAADAEPIFAQLDAVLKSTGGAAGVTRESVMDLAGALQKTTTFADDEIVAMDNLLLTFTSIGKEVFPDATRTALDMSIALGQDTKNSAIQMGKALNDPITGVTALRKVGVSFTEEQMKQIKTMQQSGNIMGAQKLILKELQKEFGGSAEAAGKTFGGSLTILKNALFGIVGTIGESLLPILTQLATGLSEALDNPAVQAGIQTIINALGSFISDVLPRIIAGLQSVVAWVQENWPLIQTAIVTAWNNIKALVEPVINAIGSFIRSIFGSVATFLQTHGEDIKGFISTTWNTIKSIVEPVVQWFYSTITTIFGGLATFISQNQGEIQRIFQGVWDGIKMAVGTVLELIRGIVNTVLALLRGDVQGALDAVKMTFVNIWEGIKGYVGQAAETMRMILAIVWFKISEAVTTVWASIRKWVEQAWEDIITFFKTLPDRLYQIGKQIIEGLWNGIKSMFAEIGHGIENFFSNIINDAKKTLGIASPSTLMAGMGANLMLGLAQGIERSARLPRAQMAAALDDLSSTVTLRAQADLSMLARPTRAEMSADMVAAGPAIVNHNYINDSLSARIILEQQRNDLTSTTRAAY